MGFALQNMGGFFFYQGWLGTLLDIASLIIQNEKNKVIKLVKSASIDINIVIKPILQNTVEISINEAILKKVCFHKTIKEHSRFHN